MTTIYWLIAALSIAGVLTNIHGRRICFVLWSISSATWTVADIAHGLPQQAAVQAVYFGLSLYGLRRWSRRMPVTTTRSV